MAKTKLGRKLVFASADIFGGGSFNIINFLYPGFLAITVGITPYWIGVIMLIARMWDAITDPLMGYISDRTTSGYGKKKNLYDYCFTICSYFDVLSLFAPIHFRIMHFASSLFYYPIWFLQQFKHPS